MTSLGPYTLLRRLGAGGMGEVWIARREMAGGAKLVALKTVLPEKAGNAESRRSFLDEARLSMTMSNSNIVQVFDVGETSEGLAYMAMEYVEGGDLRSLALGLWARGEQFSHSVIAYVIGEILKGLAYAHDHVVEGEQRTVVHRDISPQNVLVSRSGEVKVTDFGIARLASQETSGSFVRGKLRYMPPDQFDRGVRKPTLDLFAVGAILHELLDGRVFREGDYDDTVMIGMCVRGTVPPLTCPPERVPPEFEQLRAGLLEPVAAKRIQSAREAHRMLTRWPGDRDARFELEELVQRVLGVGAASQASGSGLAVVPEKVSTSKERLVEPARTELMSVEIAAQAAAQAVPTPAVEPPKPARVEPDTERTARAAQRDEDATDQRNREMSATQVLAASTTSTRERPAPVASNGSRWLALALALIGVSIGVTSLAFALGWVGGDEPAVAVEIAPAEEPPPPGEPAPSEPAPSEPPREQPKADPTPTEVPPSPEPPPTEPTPTEPETTNTKLDDEQSKPPPPKPIAKTEVTLKASGVYMQVKLGSKEYTFDKATGGMQIEVKLKPGEYPISKRTDETEPWQSLGKIQIPEGKPVTVEIQQSKAVVRPS